MLSPHTDDAELGKKVMDKIYFYCFALKKPVKNVDEIPKEGKKVVAFYIDNSKKWKYLLLKELGGDMLSKLIKSYG